MYYRELRDGNKILRSTMLMLTKSDAEYCATVLTEAQGPRPEFIYKADRRFMGYEGYDGTVNKHLNNGWGHPGKQVDWIRDFDLRNMCKDRPIVPQNESHL
jgi:hypothetical protein